MPALATGGRLVMGGGVKVLLFVGTFGIANAT